MGFFLNYDKKCIFSSIKEKKKVEEHFIRSWKDKEGNNLLHRAVIDQERAVIEYLSGFDYLVKEKNHFDLTPQQLSGYLIPHKINSAQYDKIAREYEIEIVPAIVFESYTLLKKVLKRHRKALKKDQIDRRQKWLGAYWQKDIFEPKLNKVEIKWIDEIKGNGLFAKQNILEGSFIGEYGGVIRKPNAQLDKSNSYCFDYPLNFFVSTKLLIDAQLCGNITRFINHSYKPNLISTMAFYNGVNHIVFLANRDIEKGEELRYDYGPNYWSERDRPIE